MEKKLMLHFFHERNYVPQSLEEFEREAALDNAAGIMADLHFDSFIWMPLIAERVISRPLVPDPAALTETETADDAKEDIFLFSSQLPRQLEQKVRTMLAHMRDADRIYESKNK